PAALVLAQRDPGLKVMMLAGADEAPPRFPHGDRPAPRAALQPAAAARQRGDFEDPKAQRSPAGLDEHLPAGVHLPLEPGVRRRLQRPRLRQVGTKARLAPEQLVDSVLVPG